jgi:hypothetical protein
VRGEEIIDLSESCEFVNGKEPAAAAARALNIFTSTSTYYIWSNVPCVREAVPRPSGKQLH